MNLAKITYIREYLQESYKNGINLKVQENLTRKCIYCIYLTDISCKKFEQIRNLLLKSSKILAFLAPLARFLKCSARIVYHLTRSCRKLPRILQVLSGRLTRVTITPMVDYMMNNIGAILMIHIKSRSYK